MPRVFLVQIDVDRLRANLSRQESRPVSQEEVVRWLAEAGFTSLDRWWQVSEADLGQLEPQEVTAARPFEESPQQGGDEAVG